jgi:hypothetical protein
MATSEVSLIDQFKLADKFEKDAVIEVLHECSKIADQQGKPAKDNFLRLLDVAEEVTSYNKAQALTPSERHLCELTLIKVLSYMKSRVAGDSVEEVKSLVKEVIIEAAKLHANIDLNN